MERGATQSNGPKKQNHGQSFLPVFDSRKRKILGLWLRGERYYAQLRVDLGNGRTAPRRLALTASNLDEAKGELERKRTERRDGKLPQTGHRPKFEDFAREYLASSTLAQKKQRTQDSERQAIGRWTVHLGGVRLDKITSPLIHAFREKRLKAGASARTVNLDTIGLRNVLKFARERGLLAQLPEARQLKQKPSPKKNPAEQSGVWSAVGVGHEHGDQEQRALSVLPPFLGADWCARAGGAGGPLDRRGFRA